VEEEEVDEVVWRGLEGKRRGRARGVKGDPPFVDQVEDNDEVKIPKPKEKANEWQERKEDRMIIYYIIEEHLAKG
jgi:hypothetical protein